MNTDSEIVKAFGGQSVFLTGGTGFLGKLLIEKLLRCTEVKRIYILVRMKKGKPVASRYEEMFENSVFDKMKENKPNYRSVVKLIYGDCLNINLGLSQEDQTEIISNVTCVIHCAATVRFDQHIKAATYINVRATRDLLKMAEQMPNLKAFVHVSTAYSHCTRNEIDEKFYDTYITGENLIQTVDLLDNKLLEEITPKLLKNWPNTYVFTKALAEEVVRSYSGKIPLAVVRPGQILSTKYEPYTGWVDNFYGCIGIVVGVGAGVLRVLNVDQKTVLDIIPADYVINTTLAVASDLSKKRNKTNIDLKLEEKPTIYNSVTGITNPLSIYHLKKYLIPHACKYLSTNAIWYPLIIFCPNIYIYYFLEFFMHTLPGYLFDGILVLVGKKPMLIEGYKKMAKHMEVIAYFSSRHWIIRDNNTQILWKNLNDSDKELFNFDTYSLDWKNYLKSCVIGGRIYLLKDPISTLTVARTRAAIYKILHYTLVTVLSFFAFLVCIKLLSIVYNFINK